MSIKLKRFCSILMISIAATGLAACGSFYTDTCDEVYHPKYKLADCQKKVGNFKKGKTTHYEHSDGFEFDLTVTEDSTYNTDWSDYCVVAKEEDRNVVLTSNYPIMSVEVHFSGRINVNKEEIKDNDALDYYLPINISHEGTGFYVDLDTNGTPMDKGIENTFMMLDTITFNGVTYDSVFVIMDNAHYNGLNYHERAPGDTAYLYFSKEKGILRLETIEGKSFTIKEGGDNE